MRLKLVAAALAALTLSGCMADPLVHGPFLIGAENQRQLVNNCRAADVRSQDARTDWYEHCNADSIALGTLPNPEWNEELGTVEQKPALNKKRSAWD